MKLTDIFLCKFKSLSVIFRISKRKKLRKNFLFSKFDFRVSNCLEKENSEPNAFFMVSPTISIYLKISVRSSKRQAPKTPLPTASDEKLINFESYCFKNVALTNQSLFSPFIHQYRLV